MKTSALSTAKTLATIFQVLFTVGCFFIPIAFILFLLSYPSQWEEYPQIDGSSAIGIIGMIIIGALAFLQAFIGMKIMRGLKQLLKSFEEGNYFKSENISVLSDIAKRLKYFIIIYFPWSIFDSMAKGEFEIELSLSSPTLILIFITSLVYILSEIFKHGLKIQEEQNLTV